MFTGSTSVNNLQIYFAVSNATNIKLGVAYVSSALLGFIQDTLNILASVDRRCLAPRLIIGACG
jgi:hypothetical protein